MASDGPIPNNISHRERSFSVVTGDRSDLRRSAIESINRGVADQRGLMLLTGVRHCGKTRLLMKLMAEAPVYLNYLYCTVDGMGFDQLLTTLCGDLQVSAANAERPQKLKALKAYLTESAGDGIINVLVVDDADTLGRDALNHLLMFFQSINKDLPSVQLILSGLPELERRLPDRRRRHRLFEQAVYTRLARADTSRSNALVPAVPIDAQIAKAKPGKPPSSLREGLLVAAGLTALVAGSALGINALVSPNRDLAPPGTALTDRATPSPTANEASGRADTTLATVEAEASTPGSTGDAAVLEPLALTTAAPQPLAQTARNQVPGVEPVTQEKQPPQPPIVSAANDEFSAKPPLAAASSDPENDKPAAVDKVASLDPDPKLETPESTLADAIAPAGGKDQSLAAAIPVSTNTPEQPLAAKPVVAAAETTRQPVPDEGEPVDSSKPAPIALTSEPFDAALDRRAAGAASSGVDVEEFVRRGEKSLEMGDVASARLFFLAGAETGHLGCVVGVGMTWDPLLLQQRGLKGVYANAEEALSWYVKAANAGFPSGEQRAAALEQWLSEPVRSADTGAPADR